MQFTASQALVDKLRQAQALLSHRMPSGDLAEILAQALTLLNERLLKERFALGASRGPAPTTATANEPAPTAASGEPAPTTVDADADADADAAPAIPASPAGGSRHLPNAIKREVVRRDGLRCAFVDGDGRRCEQTRLLEFHHRVPWG